MSENAQTGGSISGLKRLGDWELSALDRTMRRVRGSDAAKGVESQIVNKPIENLETGIVATVSGGSFGKMISASARDLGTSEFVQGIASSVSVIFGTGHIQG